MNRNLVGSNYGRSSIKIAHYDNKMFNKDIPEFTEVTKQRMEHGVKNEINNLYRRPSIVASYQVSVHLAKKF